MKQFKIKKIIVSILAIALIFSSVFKFSITVQAANHTGEIKVTLAKEKVGGGTEAVANNVQLQFSDGRRHSVLANPELGKEQTFAFQGIVDGIKMYLVLMKG